MNKKLIGLAIIGALFIGAIAYFFLVYRKKGTAGELDTAKALTPGEQSLADLDNRVYNQLVQFMKDNTTDNGAALNWMLPYIKSNIDGTNANYPKEDVFKIGGKLAKSRAFMAVYGPAWFKVDGSGMNLKAGLDPLQFNQGMFNIYGQFSQPYQEFQITQ